MDTTWKELNIHKKIAYITAIIAFFIGFGLTIAGFIIGDGDITDSVLWVLGQVLVYCASIFGVGIYTTNAVRGMRQDINDFMHKKEPYPDIEDYDYQPSPKIEDYE